MKDITPRVCCPNGAAPGAGGPPGTGLNGAPPGPPLRLDFKSLFSARPLHFLSGLRDDAGARGFL
jgi:hypothetical protein